MPSYGGYSSQVNLRLFIGGVRLELSHVGQSGLVVRHDCEPIPPGNAELEITVDQNVDVRQVFLPHGVPGARVRIPFF